MKTQKNKEVDLESRERLLKVGKKQFLLDGSRGLSVRKVAKEARVNLGSFVYHFKTRELFIQKVIQAHYEDFITVFNDAFEKINPSAKPIEKLESLLDVMSGFVSQKGPLIARLIVDLMQGEDPAIQAFLKSPPRHLPVTLEIIRECQAEKSIRNDISPEFVYLLCACSVGVSQILTQQVGQHLKIPAAKKMRLKLEEDEFRKTRIHFALKGLKL